MLMPEALFLLQSQFMLTIHVLDTLVSSRNKSGSTGWLICWCDITIYMISCIPMGYKKEACSARSLPQRRCLMAFNLHRPPLQGHFLGLLIYGNWLGFCLSSFQFSAILSPFTGFLSLTVSLPSSLSLLARPTYSCFCSIVHLCSHFFVSFPALSTAVAPHCYFHIFS